MYQLLTRQDNRDVHGLSAVYPRPICGLASALSPMTLTHCEEPGLVNSPRLVCPGGKTGPISTGSSVVLPGPLVGREFKTGRGQTVCTDCCPHAGCSDSRAGYQAGWSAD